MAECPREGAWLDCFWMKCESTLPISSRFLSRLLSFENSHAWFYLLPLPGKLHHIPWTKITHWQCMTQPRLAAPLAPIFTEALPSRQRCPRGQSNRLLTWAEGSGIEAGLWTVCLGISELFGLLLVCFCSDIRDAFCRVSFMLSSLWLPIIQGEPSLFIWGLQILIGSSGHPKFSWFQCRFVCLFICFWGGERQTGVVSFLFSCLKKQGPAISAF